MPPKENKQLVINMPNTQKTPITKDLKCVLNENQCKELDTIRISLWEDTIEIEQGSKKLNNNLNKLINMIKGTLQDPYYSGELLNVTRMARFLENGELYELKDEKNKSYRKPGYYNNIINQIEADCGCPSRYQRTADNKLKVFHGRLR